jgi:hypothetical protein
MPAAALGSVWLSHAKRRMALSFSSEYSMCSWLYLIWPFMAALAV